MSRVCVWVLMLSSAWDRAAEVYARHASGTLPEGESLITLLKGSYMCVGTHMHSSLLSLSLSLRTHSFHYLLRKCHDASLPRAAPPAAPPQPPQAPVHGGAFVPIHIDKLSIVSKYQTSMRANETISALKQWLWDEHQLPVETQRLAYNGKTLQDKSRIGTHMICRE